MDTASPAEGVSITATGEGRFLTGLNAFYRHITPVFLYLLGIPKIVEIAQEICGQSVICSHDWMVVKNAGDGQEVLWHQDFVNNSLWPAINIGIHLDGTEQDAVHFIPSARSPDVDICDVKESFHYSSQGVVSVPVSAGGLTVHDVLLVHGSPGLSDRSRRKTLYLEFRPLEMLAGHATINAVYIRLRQQLFDCAKRSYVRANNDFSDQVLVEEERSLVEALSMINVQIDPANYCFNPAS